MIVEIYVPQAAIFLTVFGCGVITGALGMVLVAVRWSKRR